MTEPTPRRRGHVYRRLRRQYLRQHVTCHLCGRPGADTVDHVIPLHLGGSEIDINNWAPAHLSCNSRRGINNTTTGLLRWDADGINDITPSAAPSRDW